MGKTIRRNFKRGGFRVFLIYSEEYRRFRNKKKLLSIIVIMSLAVFCTSCFEDAESLYATAEKYNNNWEYGKAFSYFQKAAEKGHVNSQYMLGRCYDSGKGIRQDDAEAVKWFRKAAEQGQPEAQYQLGCCYALGRGVRQDYIEAVNWFRKATYQEYAEAQHQMGLCYALGRGVRQNDAEAVKWFHKAAEQGDALAKEFAEKLSARLTE